MELRDGADEAEAETVPGRAAAAFEAYETIEHRVAPIGRHARAGIADLDPCLAGMCRDTERDLALVRIFERVVEKVGDRLRQQMAVAAHHDPIGDAYLEAEAVLVGHGLVEIGDVARDLG